MNGTYMIGFSCGLLIALIIGVVLRIQRKNKYGCEYDERQEAIRGTGFKYAYFSAIIVMVLGGVAEIILDTAWCGLFTFAILTLWASICVFTTYCVIKDAYFTLRSKRSLLIVIFLAASVINIIFGIDSLRRGEIIVNAALNLNAANLITGAGCLYIGAMMLVHSLCERRQEDAE